MQMSVGMQQIQCEGMLSGMNRDSKVIKLVQHVFFSLVQFDLV